jgi:two-component system chemotaxis response regulator CheY
MKFLLADDDPTLRMLMQELLHNEFECEVLEAANGLEAWQLLDSGPSPDLCIFDLRMPKIGGLELLTKLRSDPRFMKQKIMVCSTMNDRSTVLHAASLRVNAFLLKPFLADAFIALVRRHCGDLNEAVPPETLQSLTIMLERLRISREKYLELLEVLTTEVAKFITEMGDQPVCTVQNELQLRLGAIRGASLTLGASALATTISELEKAIFVADDASILSSIAAIETENNGVMAAAAQIGKKHAHVPE